MGSGGGVGLGGCQDGWERRIEAFVKIKKKKKIGGGGGGVGLGGQVGGGGMGDGVRGGSGWGGVRVDGNGELKLL